MSEAAWRRAGREDLPALEAYLRSREPEAAGFIGRLLRDGRLRLPNPLRGAVYVLEEAGGEALGGALLASPTRAVFPLLDGARGSAEGRTEGSARGAAGGRHAGGASAASADSDRGLADLLLCRGYEPVSIVGLAAEVERLEAALGLMPLVPVSYRLMARPASAGAASSASPRPAAETRARDSRHSAAEAGPAAAPPSPASPRPSPAARADAGPPTGACRTRLAGPADLDELYPLQEAYEKEEVLTLIHRFEPAATRAALARSLEERIVVAAEVGGFLVGKAGTNARAFGLDQVGGVYVAPPYRGRGIGRALMEDLLGRLASEGRGASLFVKTHNEPARGLYSSLGFEDLADFRADYFAS